MGRDCPRILERLTAYIDELLPADERAEIERHLGHCPPCQSCASEEQTARIVLRARAVFLRLGTVPSDLRVRCEELLKGRKPPGELP